MDGQSNSAGSFQSWFGNSAAVDAAGQPLLLYHGSREVYLERFDLAKEGTGCCNTRGRRWGAIWFTSDRENALFFADSRDNHPADSDGMIEYGEEGCRYVAICDAVGNDLFQVGPYGTRAEAMRAAQAAAAAYNADPCRGDAVHEVFLSLQNPLVIQGEIPRQEHFQRARDGGHDGLIARDVCDGPRPSDVYVVFKADSIRFTRDFPNMALRCHSVVFHPRVDAPGIDRHIAEFPAPSM